MANEEILKATIEKAEKNGYSITDKLKKILEETCLNINLNLYCKIIQKEPHALIFRHDFAKAFWGDQMTAYIVEEQDECGDLLFFWGENIRL